MSKIVEHCVQKRRPVILLGGFALLCVTLGDLAVEVRAAETASPQQIEFFEQHVRPVLVEHCQRCHGAKTQESGLRLDLREAMLQGGDSGPAVVPGKPDDSLLLEAVRHESLQMPPDERLTDEQVAALERWVRMGAPWPVEAVAGPALGDQQHIRRVAQSHWSLQPVHKPDLPTVRNETWVKTPLDAFILARLEDAGLSPSPPADRRTLLRRVTFDLTGLPPTAEEIAEFEADSSPDAFEQIVDRLLETPQYGERWGRHWLDVARYADTRDWLPQIDTRYPFAYTYRDWVVEALNRDLPYDEFLRLQLAADLYVDRKDSPDLAALGFLTVGPRYRNNVHEQAADRIDVVTRGLMGLTVTCARCHDHKYDPVTIADYYALYGVFASAEIPDSLPVIASAPPSPELRKDYERQRTKRQTELDEYKTGLVDEALADLRGRIDEYLAGFYDMNLAKTESIRGLIEKRKLKETAMTPLAVNLNRITQNRRLKEHPVLRPWSELIDVPDARFERELEAWLARHAESADDDAAAGESDVNPLVLTALRDDPPASRLEFLARYAAVFTQALDAWDEHSTMNPNARRLPDADLEDIRRLLVGNNGLFTFQTEAVVRASRLLAPGRRNLAQRENALLELDLTHDGAPLRAMVLAEKDEPVDPVVFLRGDPRRRGDAVPRRFLSVLAGDDAAPFENGSGRRELAEAIVASDNPLTPRVLVNRVWMQYFGQGLVATPGDFGLRSEPPSHPELLDWLAAVFVEQGWSLKKLHRLIVLSNVYQQSSSVPATTATEVSPQTIDPENRLLWRANRRRLDFEAMRDALLATSGTLDRAVGGKPVPLSEQPFTTRRTLYGFIDRVNLDPLYATFNFPAPDATAPERPETLVPQQALFAMNHPFVIEQARQLVKLPEFKSQQDDAGRVETLYRRLFGRAPLPAETEFAGAFIQAATGDTVQPQVAWQYGYGPADPELPPDERFTPFEVFTGSAYQYGQTYPHPELGFLRLTSNGGQAGRDRRRGPIRRWTAPANAVIEIGGTLEHPRDKGDGMQATIIAGRGGILGQWTVFNEQMETTVARYEVQAGETIDFIIDCRANGSNDTFNWTPTIRTLEGPERHWDAQTEFAAPPPPPLGPWEQVAQALLLTNEFLFLD